MFATFPELLFLAPLSAMLIRASVAALFIIAGVSRFRHPEETHKVVFYTLALIEIAVGALLAVGLYTQGIALIAFFLILAWLFALGTRPFPKSTVLLMLVLSISLVFTGAGPISFDLPL